MKAVIHGGLLSHARSDAESRRRFLDDPAHFRRGFLADAIHAGEVVGRGCHDSLHGAETL